MPKQSALARPKGRAAKKMRQGLAAPQRWENADRFRCGHYVRSMSKGKPTQFRKNVPEWRAFEILAAEIEERLAPHGAVVKCPDHILDIDTGQTRQIDASIKITVGSADILIAVECRRRGKGSDVTWIDALATKRIKIGAAKIIAVSRSPFSKAAVASANRYGIELRRLGEITEEHIDEWANPAPLTHGFREASDMKCLVVLEAGANIEFDGLESRFRHPHVDGVFPAAAFLSFIEMKDPTKFLSTGLATNRIEIKLDASDPEIIPIPLGEIRKSGGLCLECEEGCLPIKTVTITLSLEHRFETLQPEKGRHFKYEQQGVQESPIAMLSEFQSGLFGMPVKIQRFNKAGAPSTAMLSFPGDLKLPASLLNTRITDVANFDVKAYHMMPVTIKIFEGDPMDGCFTNLDLLDSYFDTEEDRANFDAEYVMFVEKIALLKIKRAKRKTQRLVDLFNNHSYKLKREIIEYIDISSAISAGTMRAR